MSQNTVFETEEFELYDGTPVTLSPLPIARLREFLATWERASDLPEDDDGFDLMVECSGIALAHNFKDKFEREDGSNGLFPTKEQKAAAKRANKPEPVLSQEYKDYLLEVLELPTIKRCMFVVGGIDFDNPKLQEAMIQAQLAQGGEEFDLVSLEAEAMLTGNWTNFAQLEEQITLPELEAIVKAARARDHKFMRFYGMFKGVDIDEGQKTKFEEVQRRAEARLAGKSVEEIERGEELSFEDFGFEVETDLND